MGLENVALWHERDISHSSAERVALPDACLALDYMLVTFTGVVEGLVVEGERMLENLDDTRGLVFSQALLLALVEEQGLDRDAAYRIVQRNALRAWDEKRQLRQLVEDDPDVRLSSQTIDRCFSTGRFLDNAGVVFDRLDSLVLQPASAS